MVETVRLIQLCRWTVPQPHEATRPREFLDVNESRLRRACLAVTGQSPIDLVHLRLLVEAERQLRYTSMPVTQVAYYLGFDDPAYFTRFFTRRMGLSPRAFRARDGFERREER